MIRIIKLIIWIAIISGGIFFWQYSQFENTVLTQEESTIEITAGTYRNALIRAGANSLFTKIYLFQNTPETVLQKGKYIIPTNSDIPAYIQALQTPINTTDEKVTFLEGWNIYDIDQTLDNKSLIAVGEFSNYVTDVSKFAGLKSDYPFISDAETLEGFLYPDTYNINPNSFTVEGLVRKMLTNFQIKVIDSGIITNMGSIEIIDIINMASIVQKETAFRKKLNGVWMDKTREEIFEEASTVAGVLKKRASEGWQIGADATVCYAHKISTQDCTPTQVLRYLYDKNSYNTRAMVGLPAGPIANPEASVIEATMKSKNTEYYYYLHDNSGQIHYGVTNADHESNKNKYLR